jgi:hypothetical protein
MVGPTLAYAGAYALRRADARLLRGRGRLEPLARRLDPSWRTLAVNNAVIGARPGAPFLRRVLAAALAADPGVRYALGPSLVTRAVQRGTGDVAVLPPDVFYVQPPSYSFRFFEGGPFALPSAAVLIHYVSSNHGARLAAVDEATLRRRAPQGLFYTLAADVAERARALPRRRLAA